MLNKDKKTVRLLLLLMVFLGLWGINIIIPIDESKHEYPYQLRQNYFIVCFIVLFSLLIIIFKFKNIRLKDLVIAIIISILAYNGDVLVGVLTCFAYIASLSILNGSDYVYMLIKCPSKKDFKKNLILVLGVGSFLGAINVITKVSSYESININLRAFILALKPGISEEVVFRLFLYSVIILLLGGKIEYRVHYFLSLIIMIFPFALFHAPDMAAEVGIGYAVLNSIFLSLVFALPLTRIFLKHGLFIAMCTHTLIDFITFCVLGY